MPVNATTIAARAAAVRLNDIENLHLSAAYRRELVLLHSPALTALSAALTTASAPANIINAANVGAQALGDADVFYGNMGNVLMAKQVVVPAINQAAAHLEGV